MFKNDSDYLDQHFLMDEDIINKFIKICDLNRNDVVLEIGPGKGILTKLIASKVKKVYAIEKDIRLKEFLDKIDNLEVIYGDAIKCDYPLVNKIITAIPYSIIEPFMYKLCHTSFDSLYMIMGSTYVKSVLNYEINNLALLTNCFFDVKWYFDVPRECFYPEPKTLSSAIRITPKRDYKPLELLFKNMYLLDDKKIKNALMESLIKVKGLTKRESKDLINSLNISDEFLDKKFLSISNQELKELYAKLNSLHVN